MASQSDIQKYGLDVNDIEASAFEMIDMLYLRSKIHRYFHELSDNDKNEVSRYDLILISNAQSFYEKLNSIYDFQNQNRSEDEWWWHLHKVAKAFHARNFTISFANSNGDLLIKMV